MKDRIVYQDKVYTKYIKKLIRYEGDIYFENSPFIKVSKDKILYKRKAINQIQAENPSAMVGKSDVEEIN